MKKSENIKKIRHCDECYESAPLAEGIQMSGGAFVCFVCCKKLRVAIDHNSEWSEVVGHLRLHNGLERATVKFVRGQKKSQ